MGYKNYDKNENFPNAFFTKELFNCHSQVPLNRYSEKTSNKRKKLIQKYQKLPLKLVSEIISFTN